MSTAETVSGGMKWDRAAAEKALDNHVYLKIDPAKKNGGRLTLSGAEKRFEKYPRYIYVPDFRIAGDVDAIRQLLTMAGNLTADQIEAYIQGAYNVNNTKPGGARYEDFEKEKALAKAFHINF